MGQIIPFPQRSPQPVYDDSWLLSDADLDRIEAWQAEEDARRRQQAEAERQQREQQRIEQHHHDWLRLQMAKARLPRRW
jgi:hypothetical protein